MTRGPLVSTNPWIRRRAGAENDAAAVKPTSDAAAPPSKPAATARPETA